MAKYPETELVLNSDGSLYHLCLRPEDVSDLIITVGDPDRVAQVSKYFDRLEVQKQKREFRTHTGYVGKRRVTVISSGIGPDNVEILMNELDALANIDLTLRADKAEHTKLKLVRVGTCGSLQKHVATDDFLVSRWAVGLDNLMQYYQLPQTAEEDTLTAQLSQQLGLSFQPYALQNTADFVQCTLLQQRLDSPLHQGNTLTCPGFYAPQGRALRAAMRFDHWIPSLEGFAHEGFMFHNFEMETASYLAFARLLGHEFVSLNAILANRITHQFSRQPEQQIEKLIVALMEQIERIK